MADIRVKIKDSANTVYAGLTGVLVNALKECDRTPEEYAIGFVPDNDPGIVCYEIDPSDYILLGS